MRYWRIPVIVYVDKKDKKKKVQVLSVVMEKNGRKLKDVPVLKRMRRVYG